MSVVHGRPHFSIGFVAALAALTACSQPPTPPDAFGVDGALFDVQARDVPTREEGIDAEVADAADAATDAVTTRDAGVDAATDANVVNPCDSVVDLNMVGTVTGATTTYSGSNTAAPAAGSIPGVCVFDVASEVVFRFTTSTESHLRVSTTNPGTPQAFDSVAWMIDRCSPSNTALGCSDDSAPGDRRSLFTTANLLPAGSTVFIVVAGYSPPRPSYHVVDQFELSVTEIEEVSLGGSCDLGGVANVCEAHSHCLGDASSATCVRDGTRGGRCNAAPPGCDPGLGCNGDRLSATTRCVTELPRGAHCDPTMQTNVCVAGTICNDLGAGPTCL